MLTKTLMEMDWLSQQHHPDPPNEVDIASPLPNVDAAQVLFSYQFNFDFDFDSRVLGRLIVYIHSISHHGPGGGM